MKLSKKEELLALGAALYLLGIEVEASRSRLERLFDLGFSLSSQEIVAETDLFNQLSFKFSQLEDQYIRLEGEK